MAIQDEIDALEAILNAGTASVQVDGQKVDYDLAEARRRLTELQRQQTHTKRPRASSIDLTGF